jgi:hypothetical protein
MNSIKSKIMYAINIYAGTSSRWPLRRLSVDAAVRALCRQWRRDTCRLQKCIHSCSN